MPESSEFDDIARMLTERIVDAVQDGGTPLSGPAAPDDSGSRQTPRVQFRRLPNAPPPLYNSPLLYRSSREMERRRRRNNTIDLVSLMPVFAMAFAVILKVGPGLGVNLLEEFQFALSFVRVLLFTCIILGVVGIYLKPTITKLWTKLTTPPRRLPNPMTVRGVVSYDDHRNRPALRAAPPSTAIELATDTSSGRAAPPAATTENATETESSQ